MSIPGGVIVTIPQYTCIYCAIIITISLCNNNLFIKLNKRLQRTTNPFYTANHKIEGILGTLENRSRIDVKGTGRSIFL